MDTVEQSKIFGAYTNTTLNIYEPAHDKTYNKTCVTNEDSDQPVHLPSMARVLVYPTLVSLKAHAISEDSELTARMRRLT